MKKERSWKEWIPSKPSEWFFMLWLIVAPLTLLFTGFLPIILSVYHDNWLYFAMYHWIGAPLVIEVLFFLLWFKLLDL